ncbi:MAG: HK97 family phage prohead protease [Actinomyces sp.]|nr:MAG: HK97 family phage prohead protease [Actinomyces sp.]
MTTLDDITQERERGMLGALEVRAAAADVGDGTADAPVIEGLGSVADQRTTIEGFFSAWDEEVAPGAWRKTISDGRRILSMFNHDPSRLLGSTDAGTLRLVEVPEGLHYSVDINPDDPLAVSAHAQVMRGDVAGSSVWFRVIREQWTEPTDDNGLERPLRRILEAQLFETGPVTMPAFEQTTAAARSLAAVDSMLRSAGMRSSHKRAALTFATFVDPGDAVEEFRDFLDRHPEVREAVCDCKLSDGGRAAGVPAPDPDGPPPAGHLSTPALSVARARLDLMRRPVPAA